MARARNTRSRHTSSLPCTHGDLAPLPQDLPVKPESPSFLRPSTSSSFFPHQNNTNRATGYPLFTWNSASLNSKVSFYFLENLFVYGVFFFFYKRYILCCEFNRNTKRVLHLNNKLLDSDRYQVESLFCFCQTNDGQVFALSVSGIFHKKIWRENKRKII